MRIWKCAYACVCVLLAALLRTLCDVKDERMTVLNDGLYKLGAGVFHAGVEVESL